MVVKISAVIKSLKKKQNNKYIHIVFVLSSQSSPFSVIIMPCFSDHKYQCRKKYRMSNKTKNSLMLETLHLS